MVYKLDEADKLCGVTYIDWDKHYSKIPTATCDMLETQCDKVIIDLDCGQEDNKDTTIYKEYHYLKPDTEEEFKQDLLFNEVFTDYNSYKEWVKFYNDSLYKIEHGESQYGQANPTIPLSIFKDGIYTKYGHLLLPNDPSKTYTEERATNPDGSLLIAYTVTLPEILREV